MWAVRERGESAWTTAERTVAAAAESAVTEAREARMDRVATLYGEITSATRAFLGALAESDRHEDWREEGFGSCAEWLSWRIGITRNAANEKVRAAHALEDLPLISEAMNRGEVSYTKVRALTRAATPDNEGELLELARAGSAAKLERVIRGWKRLDRWGEAQVERMRHLSRKLSVFPDGEGMYVVTGRLSPEVGAVLMRAVEAASDALFRGERDGGGAAAGGSVEEIGAEADRPDPAQRRADALGLVAERALAAGFGAPPETAAGRGGVAEGAAEAPVSGSRAERYQVVLHVEQATLAEAGEPGQSELEDGTRVTAETARRVACDTSVVEVRHGAKKGPGDEPGAVLDVGRRRRTIPPALRRALESRDRGCRFPGCGLRFTDAHHIRHWADGGRTELKNLVLLCRTHHRRVHEEGHRVCQDRQGQVVFFTPSGKALFEAPQPHGPQPQRLDKRPARSGTQPLHSLIRRNRDRGITPDAWGTTQRYRHDRYVPWETEAAAMSVLDPP